MNKKGKIGVLLVNLGTPDSPSVPDVRKYLREFLMDKRVIDIPFINRWMLVNLIIAPLRAPKSAKVYQQLWEDRGSPLMYYGEDVRKAVQDSLGEEYVVSLAMRYQNPSIQKGLNDLRERLVSQIIVIPLFPQYASATTGSVMEKVMEIIHNWENIPSLKFISNFLEEEKFIETFCRNARKYMEKIKFDHFLFSYHGLPERQVKKASCGNYCQLNEKCCSVYHQKNQFCYRAQCFQTTRLLVEALNIPEEKYTVAFQSRLGKDPWIQPYAEDVIKTLAQNGKKKVLAFSPAFVADCLETTVEVGNEFKEIFEEAGGEHWQLVESLNNHPLWIECLKDMVLKNE
ncbi:ferrochelatase [Xanthovirga aplysinae]|uniref:ferrochelatase n=1 Tax=Xanthovirga aplysinae TaxID=2529853 RepID=UPI0012BCC973|nr:ferrochelatase [Xanthovirga aplysinae]MTI32198.1 ferrochelatase [Xanthovirga aplysinae]